MAIEIFQNFKTLNNSNLEICKTAAPISNVWYSKREFVWGDERQAAFETLKLKLMSASS